MIKATRLHLFIKFLILLCTYGTLSAQTNFLPDEKELSREFDNKDKKFFANPPKVYYPEIWVNCLGGNLSKKGILADLEAIAEGGFKGVQFFFGNRGGTWPGVDSPILCLSQEWDDFVKYAAQEAKRLGLRFTLQNCPGWAMAGGPISTNVSTNGHKTAIIMSGRMLTEQSTISSTILPTLISMKTGWN